MEAPTKLSPLIHQLDEVWLLQVLCFRGVVGAKACALSLSDSIACSQLFREMEEHERITLSRVAPPGRVPLCLPQPCFVRPEAFKDALS